MTQPIIAVAPTEPFYARPTTMMASSHDGAGYWLVTADGTVTPFGDAPDLRSGTTPDDGIASIVATPSGNGYWLADEDGAVDELRRRHAHQWTEFHTTVAHRRHDRRRHQSGHLADR